LTVLYVECLISCNVISVELFGETEEVKCNNYCGKFNDPIYDFN